MEGLHCQRRCSGDPKGPPVLEFFNYYSLLRNMFPANLVEATFKQVSGFLGDGGWAGRASLGLAWLISLPVSRGGMLQERGRGEDLDL